MTPSVTNCIEVQMPFELFWHKISQIGLKLRTMPVILKKIDEKSGKSEWEGVNNNYGIIPRV